MNKESRRTSNLKSQLSRGILLRYFGSVLLFLICIGLLFLLASLLVGLKIWWASDPLYQLLKFIETYCLPVLLVAGWLIITCHFIARPLGFLDELVDAARILAEPGDTPIALSPELKNVQDQLNLVREQALRNALLAKEAEQRKNDLIVYLAHDLKTPLTSVIGYLSLLQDEPQISQELRARYTGIALTKAQRLEELINEFFDITRFNLTSLTFEPERINVSLMAEQITSEFLPVLAEKELTWDAHIEPNIQLLCDPDKLARVFDNLIRNAVNYSYAGTPIYLHLLCTGNTVRLIIRNQGKTIPKEKLDRIFEQFFRLDSSRSSSTGGSGLGLAISKEIVDLHGGSIRAASENESITFTVTLPLNGPV